MQKWEYRCAEVPVPRGMRPEGNRHDEVLQRYLDSQGEEGFELVSMTPRLDDQLGVVGYILALKRPKP